MARFGCHFFFFIIFFFFFINITTPHLAYCHSRGNLAVTFIGRISENPLVSTLVCWGGLRLWGVKTHDIVDPDLSSSGWPICEVW